MKISEFPMFFELLLWLIMTEEVTIVLFKIPYFKLTQHGFTCSVKYIVLHIEQLYLTSLEQTFFIIRSVVLLSILYKILYIYKYITLCFVILLEMCERLFRVYCYQLKFISLILVINVFRVNFLFLFSIF